MTLTEEEKKERIKLRNKRYYESLSEELREKRRINYKRRYDSLSSEQKKKKQEKATIRKRVRYNSDPEFRKKCIEISVKWKQLHPDKQKEYNEKHRKNFLKNTKKDE